jgi:Rod binding domain-containing protein
MNPTRLETMTMHPLTAAQKERQRAEKVADQFEAVFVRSIVSSLRKTAAIGEGGMFGAGPGSDTYADWFDQNLAEQVSRTGNIGIKQKLMTDFERAGAIGRIDAAATKARDECFGSKRIDGHRHTDQGRIRCRSLNTPVGWSSRSAGPAA